MSLTNAKPALRATAGGFTLVELLVSVGLSAIVFAGILGGFTFLGRNLTRLVNTQEQDTKSRRAVYVFSQDISSAVSITSADANSLTLKVPATDGSSVLPSVVYVYNGGTFTRTKSPASPTVLLTNLKSFSFKYYNQAGNLLTLTAGTGVDLSKSSIASVKEIELNFSSAVGSSTGGTQSLYAGISPRFVLRNKPLLQ